ncbi:hypothetical protein BZL30_1181 [Mycobacterium kansasii]|uniref:Uncharacterized protein n=1 Tax=Mycobacterium kansasii TaxID=1768 RepID=A0A1V3XV17_MYCKA|nr:hypothetical protein BZL30_1181 [Mycobacterium kansasii]
MLHTAAHRTRKPACGIVAALRPPSTGYTLTAARGLPHMS